VNLQELCGQFYNNVNTRQVYIKPTYLLIIYLFVCIYDYGVGHARDHYTLVYEIMLLPLIW